MDHISPRGTQALARLPVGAPAGAAALLDYWQDKAAAAGGVPGRADFGPFELRRWLGLVSIYQQLPGGGDFRNRLEGTGIVELTGEDWTGGLSSEIDARYGTRLTADLAAALERRTPVLHRISVFQKSFRSAIRLLLPVASGAGGRADQVLLAIFAERD
ncbi:PAS domain-containing protein [Nisaea sp.]|uniref:PAS domain-containing protein n=1 Tax=Nisaea sp. TaxID=2024842 RepID=UPI003B52B081